MMLHLVKRGYKAKETRGVLLKDYEMEMIADWQVKEEQLALHRDMIATIINFGGMGVKDMVKATDIMELPYIDNINSDDLNTVSKAKELIKHIASN